MFGSAVAKYVARAGADAVVIGPGEPPQTASADQYTFGAYFDEARITRRLGWDAVWGTTDARSLERYRTIEDESGIDFFHECGSLVLIAGSIEDRTKAMLDQCAASGIKVERMSATELRRQFPNLGLPPLSGGVEGLFEREQAGFINPRQLVNAQLLLAESAGARLERAAVKSISRDKSSGDWTLVLDGGEGRQTVSAKRVVVATGAFTNHNGVLPAGRRLALHAFSEPNLLLEVNNEQRERLRGVPPVVTVDPDDSGNANLSSYFLPPIRYPDGRWYVRIGPGMQPFVRELRTVDEMSSWYARQEPDPRQTAWLNEMASLMLPWMKSDDKHSACCIIEKTPSRYPYVGYLEDDQSIVVAAGGNGHGARGSDEIGRLAMTLVTGQPWDFPIAQHVFAPISASEESWQSHDRPQFLKPPFGLC